MLITKKIGSTNTSDLILFTYSTNNVYTIDSFDTETVDTKGVHSRPVVEQNDPKKIHDAMYACLNAIGIRTRWMNNSSRWVRRMESLF